MILVAHTAHLKVSLIQTLTQSLASLGKLLQLQSSKRNRLSHLQRGFSVWGLLLVR
jgi:hypothetical protein